MGLEYSEECTHANYKNSYRYVVETLSIKWLISIMHSNREITPAFNNFNFCKQLLREREEALPKI
jgi:hypothetical protein